MPTLPVLDTQARQLHANRRSMQAQFEADQEDRIFWRNFWYRVKYGTCMLGAVGIGTFLFVVALTSIMPE